MWIYNTFIIQWDLVCGGDYLASLSQTLFEVGMMFGQMTCSVIVDKLGRKWVLIISHLTIAIMGSILTVSPSFKVYIALRTVTAFLITVSTFIFNQKTEQCSSVKL